MKSSPFFILIFLIFNSVFSQTSINNSKFETVFENSKGTETATYTQTINFYENLAATYPEISIKKIGETDSGYPLHIVIYNNSKVFDFNKIKKGNKAVILINNGIHPGEPDGIDASMLLLRDIVQNKITDNKFKNCVLVIIPIYNIGGALNRNSTTRVNQNGPKEYGFRGNARNFDLDRDFIKEDTKNTKSFAEIFHLVNPDVFVDTHVSDGADYQYGITHLFTQHNKLGNDLGAFIENIMRPDLEADLSAKNILITPYVNVWGTTPEAGFSQFFDSPRYSTGYTTLFNVLGLMIETHMLKPYKQRVEQTERFLESIINFTVENSSKIKNLRKNALSEILSKKTYPIQYKIDSTHFTVLNFKGYEPSYIKSNVTTGNRLFYDRSKPYTKPINYYNQFISTKEIKIPKAYIISAGQWPIIERLKDNQIYFKIIKNDTIVTAEEQHIVDYRTVDKPFEGHYMHYNTTVTSEIKQVHLKKGAIYIPINQEGVRYIIETLEPEAVDSFFNWNFFDSILQEKEGYSSYVFEDIAQEYLKNNPALKEALTEKIKSDSVFAKSPKSQLFFVYKNSPYFEKAYLLLPVYKIY